MEPALIRALAILLLVSAPASWAAEPRDVQDLRDALRDAAPDADQEPPAAPAEAGVGAWVALALENNPEVRAAYERWEAAVHRIARARTLPEPTIGFGLFLSSVETRVGPQRARISLQQSFPWPTTLAAGADAAAAEARAEQQRFEAVALAVSRRVEEAYWPLWEIRATRRTHLDHLEVLAGLSTTLTARLEVGTATLADLQQVDLARARLADAIETMNEREIAATARLRAAVGQRGTEPVGPLLAPAPPALPDAELDSIVDLAVSHPFVSSLGYRVDAADDAVRVAGARRWPTATVGADWIVTGPAPVPGSVDSGKDAVVVGVGLRVPLWQGTYAEDMAAARATADALRADQRSLVDQQTAAVERWLSEVRDSARRVRVTEGTLVPQAEATYTSLLGSYAAGNGTVAQVLLAQRDLLELRAELDRARADHAEAWAALDEITGGAVPRRPATEEIR